VAPALLEVTANSLGTHGLFCQSADGSASRLQATILHLNLNRQRKALSMSARRFYWPELSALGELDCQCPYCRQQFLERPIRKTKCSQCGNFVFVKKRPIDGVTVLVNAHDRLKLDDEWTQLRRYDAPPLRTTFNDRDIAHERDRLTLILKRIPTDFEARFSYAERRASEYLGQRAVGVYRNYCLDMATLIDRSGDCEVALRNYLGVCYLDANGPINAPIIFGEVSRLTPSFDVNFAGLAPAVINRCRAIGGRLGRDETVLRDLFEVAARRFYLELSAPLPPEIAWHSVAEELFDVCQ
jgi:hypothetical protein